MYGIKSNKQFFQLILCCRAENRPCQCTEIGKKSSTNLLRVIKISLSPKVVVNLVKKCIVTVVKY